MINVIPIADACRPTIIWDDCRKGFFALSPMCQIHEYPTLMMSSWQTANRHTRLRHNVCSWFHSRSKQRDRGHRYSTSTVVIDQSVIVSRQYFYCDVLPYFLVRPDNASTPTRNGISIDDIGASGCPTKRSIVSGPLMRSWSPGNIWYMNVAILFILRAAFTVTYSRCVAGRCELGWVT